ncbi:MAG: hypothetical protein QG602_43 [Verrucomicrobiota bacterium]|nr:hypothetical protein [Verrucomicrobiota bacterium]
MRASAPSDLRLPLAVVAHDAGAANLILGWIRELPATQLRLCASGPAARLFTTAFPDHALLPLATVLDGAAQLLSGTSGPQSTLEHQARHLAGARGVPSVGVIDHWVNFAPRFTREGETNLPDEIWVTDTHALALARRTFPGCAVRQLPNRYLEDIATDARYAIQPHPGVTHVLYALEPMHSDWGRGGSAGEFQALEFFCENRGRLGLPAETLIRLRPHPSDAPGKFDAWLARQGDPRLSLDTTGTLAAAIGWADWVVGCESFALVAGLAAGRRVASTLPPWAPACRLPHPEVIHLRNLAPQTEVVAFASDQPRVQPAPALATG